MLPGTLDALRARWRGHAVPIEECHGLHNIGGFLAAPLKAATIASDPSGVSGTAQGAAGNAWPRRWLAQAMKCLIPPFLSP